MIRTFVAFLGGLGCGTTLTLINPTHQVAAFAVGIAFTFAALFWPRGTEYE